RRINPLHIVQEQHHWVPFATEHRSELPKDFSKACLLFGGWQCRYCRLRSKNELDLRQHLEDDLTVHSDSGLNVLSPLLDAAGALPQDLLGEVLESLGQRGERDITLVLIEFSRYEVAMMAQDRISQPLHERCLADAGIAGNADELGKAGGRHTLERFQQPLGFRGPAVEFVRYLELGGKVSLTQPKRFEVTVGV